MNAQRPHGYRTEDEHSLITGRIFDEMAQLRATVADLAGEVQQVKTLRSFIAKLAAVMLSSCVALGAYVINATIRAEERIEHIADGLSLHMEEPAHRGTVRDLGSMSADLRELAAVMREMRSASEDNARRIEVRIERLENRRR